MEINETLSKELQVKPLKPGETKVFRRMLAGKIDPQTKEPYHLADYWQVGKEMIYDPFAKRNVLLLNVTGSRLVDNPDGTTREDPIVEAVKWPVGGDYICTERDYNTMVYLMRSNKNLDNPFRTRTRKAVYYEVNVNAAVEKEVQNFDLLLDAGNWARNATMDDLKVVQKKLGIKCSDDTLRVTIMNMIQAGEAKEVMRASGNSHAKKKIQVEDAYKYGMIIFSEETHEWFFADNLEKPICTVSPDKLPVEGLLEFFDDKKGGGHYAKLAGKVKKLYEAID